MMKKYIKVSRSDCKGSYIQTIQEARNAVAGELDDAEAWSSGTAVIFRVVEMEENEYLAMTEFMGW